MTAPDRAASPRTAGPWRPLVAALAYGAGALLLWAVAYGTDRWLRFDVEVTHALDAEGYDLDVFLGSVRFVLPLAVVVIVVAALRGLPRHAIAAATILVGGSVSCVALKLVLGRLDPFHGDAARGIGEFFPSVHTGAATSAAFALTLLAAGRLRLVVAFAAAAYAASVGIASIVAGGHFPSDVLGAFLVVAAWGSVGALVIALIGDAVDADENHRSCVRALALAAVGGAVAVPLLGYLVDAGWASDNGSSLVAISAFSLVAPLVVAGFVSQLHSAEERR